jgi:hypothetical protein
VQHRFEDGLIAGLVAATLSGLPSTFWSLTAGRDPLEATLAAGSILLPAEPRSRRLLAAAVPVHLSLSLGWALVLARVLPTGRETASSAAAGLGIAAPDLGILGRRSSRIRALPLLPQVADHIAFGTTVGYVLGRRRDGSFGAR